MIAEYWYIWLAGVIITLGYGGYNQIARMKRMLNCSMDKSTFFKGMIPFFIAGIISATCGMLLVIAVIIHIIDYTQQ